MGCTDQDLMLAINELIKEKGGLVAVSYTHLIEVEELGETERGRGGFGHTGKQ